MNPHRDDWESETEEEKLLRSARYEALKLFIDDRPGSIVLEETEAEFLVKVVPDMEETILSLKLLANEQVEMKQDWDRILEGVRKARAPLAERLEVLYIAQQHGWEVAELFSNQGQEEVPLSSSAVDEVAPSARVTTGRPSRRHRGHHSTPPYPRAGPSGAPTSSEGPCDMEGHTAQNCEQRK